MAEPTVSEQQREHDRVEEPTPLHRDVRAQQKRDVVAVIGCIRIFSAVVISTFFQPDEFYQSLEPAWQLVYGKDSGAWITWEWDHQLRSSLHPIGIMPAYLAASCLNWIVGLPLNLRATTLIWNPRLMHAGFSVLTDYSTWTLAEQVFGEQSHESAVALAFNILSPWHFFAGARSFANVVEASLTAQALASWPWEWFCHKPKTEQRIHTPLRVPLSVTCAAVAVIIRPTNGLIWLTLTVFLAFDASQMEMMQLIRAISLYGTLVLIISSGADRVFYGRWTFPPARFFGFNVVQNLSEFYGSNRNDYYVTEGLPLLLMTALPFALVGIYQAYRGQSAVDAQHYRAAQRKVPHAMPSINHRGLRALATIPLVMISVLSIISHKEVRFLYPLFPIFAVLAAPPICRFFKSTSVLRPASNTKLWLGIAFVLLNLTTVVYICLVHQRGPLAVMSYLRSQLYAVNADALILGTRRAGPSSLFAVTGASIIGLFGGATETYGKLHPISVAFLMPCHSTPWRSHLVHPEIHAWALTCEPPIGLEDIERAKYVDEADQFYADPVSWLRDNMGAVPSIDERWNDQGWDMRDATMKRPKGPTVNAFEGKERRPWPRYVVFFEHLTKAMKTVAGKAGSRYKECWRGFNSHWHDDWRRQGDVIVWCLDGSVDATKAVEEFDKADGRRGVREWEL